MSSALNSQKPLTLLLVQGFSLDWQNVQPYTHFHYMCSHLHLGMQIQSHALELQIMQLTLE